MKDKKYTVSNIISKRYSPVLFAEKPIEKEVLHTLFEAARRAPSSYNDQPWAFLVGDKFSNKNTYDLIFDALMTVNQKWAKFAPVLMVSLGEKISPTTGKENRYALHDVGLAMGTMLYQASELDVFIHQMGGFSHSKIRKNFNLPEKYEIGAAIALGYLGMEQDKYPEEIQKKEENILKNRGRKEFRDFLFYDTF